MVCALYMPLKKSFYPKSIMIFSYIFNILFSYLSLFSHKKRISVYDIEIQFNLFATWITHCPHTAYSWLIPSPLICKTLCHVSAFLIWVEMFQVLYSVPLFCFYIGVSLHIAANTIALYLNILSGNCVHLVHLLCASQLGVLKQTIYLPGR